MKKKTPRQERQDPEYLDFIRKLPCHHCGAAPPSHPHHTTYPLEYRGKSTKAPDNETMPLCWKCHRRFHDAAGPFEHWSKVERRDWQRAAVREYQRIFHLEDVF